MIELDKTYDHGKVEEKIYKMWEESGYFNPDNLPGDRREPYTIIMPPPNANAPMHLGHALFVTIEDILIRYQRMQGKKTLWQPGTDHAGFETQVVFEKKLEKEGRSRFKMQREEFYKEIWDFVQSNKHITENGLRRLGASCDWDRNIFTLDPEIVKIVYATFKKMYADGLVYRGNRLGNWCPKHQTALSDLETKYEERTEPYYYLKYGPFVISTSRPETKFGDKYVVMHPDDKRYLKYKHGEKINLEWINGPITATIIKDKAADMEFGTGIMTITPWHDAVDFEMAERLNLDKEQIIDLRGKLLPIAGEFAGMKILEARPKIIEKLAAKGLVDHIDEKYKHNVQMCYKCNTLIEPQIIPQWFVAMTKPLPDGRPSLRDMAVGAIKNKEVEIVTEKFEKIFMHWMENLRDWPISRQIWWGIPIPVWYKKPIQPIEITYFVHGTTIDNEAAKSSGHHDIELSELGGKQALELKSAVEKLKFDIIFCSDLQRARDTAETAFAGKAKIIPDSRLREIDYGELTRHDEKETSAIKLNVIEKPFPKGESYKDVEKRIKDFLEELAEKYPGKKIAIIAHQGPQLALDVLLKGYSWAEAFANDWRNTKSWQPGWKYTFDQLICIDENKPSGKNWEQDPDTFDTWFSSGQWPYATLMANDVKRGTKDFKNYFPTQVMETGWDILFFWVARMIMMSYYRTGKPPFEKVYLHGLVRDKDRQKMSKSKGNVIDPLGVIDTYGCDALRFALIFSTSAGNDIPLAEDKIKGMKHFANKLWNIARYVLANVDKTDYKTENLTEADKNIIDKLEMLKTSTTDNLENFRLHEAAQEIYQFVWHEFADVYVEESKKQMKDKKLAENTKKILIRVLINSTKLLHPFMPFITEKLWSKFCEAKLIYEDPIIMVSKWPTPHK
jgi:valyl-tRNA synthetase